MVFVFLLTIGQPTSITTLSLLIIHMLVHIYAFRLHTNNNSQYSFPNLPPGYPDLRYMKASDVRAQFQAVLAQTLAAYPDIQSLQSNQSMSYPKGYMDIERNVLSSVQWYEYPLILGLTPWKAGRPGPTRFFYTLNNDPGHFKIGYHNKTLPTTSKGYNRFSRARYHPNPKKAIPIGELCSICESANDTCGHCFPSDIDDERSRLGLHGLSMYFMRYLRY